LQAELEEIENSIIWLDKLTQNYRRSKRPLRIIDINISNLIFGDRFNCFRRTPKQYEILCEVENCRPCKQSHVRYFVIKELSRFINFLSKYSLGDQRNNKV